MNVIESINVADAKTGLSPVDVLLVITPFCDEYLPDLTFAMFKAALREAGVASRVQHEYLYFAKRIGADDYRKIMQVCTIGYGHDYCACETIFGEAAHGKTLRPFDEFIRWMTETRLPNKAFAGEQRQDTLDALALYRKAHEMAGDYLEEAAARVMASGAKIVAFLSMYQQQNAMIALARRLKKEKDAPLILAGGPNCEGDTGAALIEHIEAFDYVFTGEADGIFAPFCRRLLRDGRVPDEELPPGVVSPTKTKALPAHITTDLDALPLPDYSDFYRERDALLPERAGTCSVTVEGSRGCWWAARKPCRFCGLNGTTAHVYREKSVARFADELADFAARYPNARCIFSDNVLSLTHQKELPDELAKRAAYRENRLRIFCEIKSSASETELAKLAQAGFTSLQPGIESFSDGLLRLMDKGVSAIRQVQMMKHCRAHDISLLWYLLVGTPGETEEMTEETNAVLPKIMHLEPPNTIAHVQFMRYSAYVKGERGELPDIAPDPGYDFAFHDKDFIRRTVHLFAPTDPEELARYYDYRRIGPAYKKLHELADAWRNQPQMLYMVDKGDFIKILDTRRIAKSLLFRLSGVEADLIRAARDAITGDALTEKLAGRRSAEEIKDALAELVADNLMLHIGNEYLALPVDRRAGKT